MLDVFKKMNPSWFNRAYVYTGSVGNVFRFRVAQGKMEDGKLILQAATYSNLCYEKATDVEKKDFSWDEEGVEALKQWLQNQYDHFHAPSKFMG